VNISAPSKPHELQSATPIDYRALYYTFRERAWLIALCLVVAGLAVATILLRSPRIYAARSVLLVEQEEAKVVNIQRIQQEDFQGLESLKTVEQTLQNPALMARVIDSNNLARDPRFVPAPAQKSPTREQLTAMLAKMVEVKLRKGTRLIDIKVEHANPELAALAANSLVKEFLRQSYEQNSTASQIANEFLSAEAQELKHKLDASENALQAYKEQTRSVSLEDRQNIVVQELGELSVKATEAKSQRITCETAYQQVRALGANLDALLVLPAAANASIKEIRSNIARLESDLATLRQRYREKHPKYMQAQSQLAEWKSALEKAVLELPQTARAAYEGAQAAEEALNKALREQEAAALDLNKEAIRYNMLARDVESDRALYQAVLNRIKENAVTKDLKTSKIRIIENAEVPEKPIRPDKVNIILAGSFCGLLGGVLLVFLLNALDQSLKTVDQTEEYLGLPVLGAVPKFSELDEAEKKPGAAGESCAGKAEAFRTLRAALSMLGRKDDRRTFLFTSAVPAEGKTFCSLNHAFSLAQQGFKTVVIDCDLRRPMVEKTLLKNNERGVGVTDYLTGHKNFQEVVHAADAENLFYVPSGSDAPNPAELLAKSGFDAFIDEALAHFDRVVVDSAPIHVVSDTLLILSRMQTVCLVVRAHRTPKNAVRRVVQMLQKAGAPLAGIILNLLPHSANRGYYYEYAYRGEYEKAAS
jgi:polysaccharide biosynthesis transport protein